jgi:hypothetical protein
MQAQASAYTPDGNMYVDGWKAVGVWKVLPVCYRSEP